MKIFKKIKLKSLFIYTYALFSIFFILFILFSINSEFRSRQLSKSQVEINKINKNIYSLKNYQDNLFLYKNTQYVAESDDLERFNSEIYKLLNLVDSISNLTIIKNNDFAPFLKDLRNDVEKYQSLSDDILKINEQLYAPVVGITSQLKLIDKNVREEQKYIDLDLINYLDKIEFYRKQLFLDKITIREFDKKAFELFQKIAEIKSGDYDKYYVLLFEDNISSYYNNTQIEYSKLKEIGFDYTRGLLLYIDNQNKLLLKKVQDFDHQIVELQDSYFKREIARNIIIILLTVIINLLFLYFLYRVMYLPWTTVKPIFDDISIGQMPDVKAVSTMVEFEIITKSLNTLIKKLKTKNNIILELSKRDYNAKFEFDEKDILGQSILALQNDLLKAEEEAIHYRNTEEQQKWSATGIAKIGTVMRQNTEDIDSLAKNVLKEIIDYVNAVQGALYLYDEEKNRLVLSASISYGKQRTKNHEISPYEGILGTILIEKREYYFSQIPENYMFLETGLGYSKPKSLFVFPLLFEDKIYGVVELASLEEFEEYQRNFLLNLAIEIAITISYTEINVQTKKLLIQSNKQAKELQSNEKLFKKNQDNLKSLLRMTEQRLYEKNDDFKKKEQLVQQKVQELLNLQKEFSDKEEYIENITNEYENLKSELENKNAELRNRISDLEKRLRDKN